MRSLLLDARSDFLLNRLDEPSEMGWTSSVSFELESDKEPSKKVQIHFSPPPTEGKHVETFECELEEFSADQVFQKFVEEFERKYTPPPPFRDDVEVYQFDSTSKMWKHLRVGENRPPLEQTDRIFQIRNRSLRVLNNLQRRRSVREELIENVSSTAEAFPDVDSAIKISTLAPFVNFDEAFVDHTAAFKSYLDQTIMVNLETGIAYVLESKPKDLTLDTICKIDSVSVSDNEANNLTFSATINQAGNSKVNVKFKASCFTVQQEKDARLSLSPGYRDETTQHDFSNRRARCYDFFIKHNENIYCNKMSKSELNTESLEEILDRFRVFNHDIAHSIFELVRCLYVSEYNILQDIDFKHDAIWEAALQAPRITCNDFLPISFEMISRVTKIPKATVEKEATTEKMKQHLDQYGIKFQESLLTMQKYIKDNLKLYSTLESFQYRILCLFNQIKKIGFESKLSGFVIPSVLTEPRFQSNDFHDIFDDMNSISIDNQAFRDDRSSLPIHWVNSAMPVSDPIKPAPLEVGEDNRLRANTTSDVVQFVQANASRDKKITWNFLNEKIRLPFKFAYHHSLKPEFGNYNSLKNLFTVPAREKFETWTHPQEGNELMCKRLNGKIYIFFTDEHSNILNSKVLIKNERDLKERVQAKVSEANKYYAPYFQMEESKHDDGDKILNIDGRVIKMGDQQIFPNPWTNERWRTPEFSSSVLLSQPDAVIKLRFRGLNNPNPMLTIAELLNIGESPEGKEERFSRATVKNGDIGLLELFSNATVREVELDDSDFNDYEFEMQVMRAKKVIPAIPQPAVTGNHPIAVNQHPAVRNPANTSERKVQKTGRIMRF